MNTKKQDILLGWILFCISSLVYLYCCEPSVSFWDCGEFIATSTGLQVGHAPGAPLYQLFSHFFSLFSIGKGQAAYMVNAFSAFAGGGTILFLYWSCSYLFKKVLASSSLSDKVVAYMSMISAATAALFFAFSDTFWRLATEAEVYAFSVFFIAAIFWCMLKWNAEPDHFKANRWILLIFYLLGLSAGVHLLCLLVIPALIPLVYFKNNHKSLTIKQVCILTFLGLGCLILWIFVLLPLPLKLLQALEFMFVNFFRTPEYWGSGIGLLLIIVLPFAAAFVFRRKKRIGLLLLASGFFLIGYSSYTLLVIRSQAQVPINEEAPDDVFRLEKYLERDAYRKPPLLYGPVYTAKIIGFKDLKPEYNKIYQVITERGDSLAFLQKEEAEAYITSYEGESFLRLRYDTLSGTQASRPLYAPEAYTLFPRMYSPSHASGYALWVGDPENKYVAGGEVVDKPSFQQQLAFYLRYQLGYMYFRYLMWNFSGRFSDSQGLGDWQEGQWVSGIPPVDRVLVGTSTQAVPESLRTKGMHVYFLIPFLLGLLGIAFMMKHHKKMAYMICFLFIMTGAALNFYLNEVAYQPRERDYIYIGSFYFFSICLGFGVLSFIRALFSIFQTKVRSAIFVSVLAGCSLCFWVFWQNKNDHKAGGAYARDMAVAYLESCPPHSVLFCLHDNETFPLWYLQETEGIRTDVRVVNLSLLSFDWYINQCKRKLREADALPLSFSEQDYIGIGLNYVPINYENSEYEPCDKMIREMAEKGEISTRFLYKCIRRGDKTDTFFWQLPLKSGLYKKDLILLDILSHMPPERPLCFTEASYAMELQDHLALNGMVYQLFPNSDTLNRTTFMTDFDKRVGGKKIPYANEVSRRAINKLCRRSILLSDSLFHWLQPHLAVELLNTMLSVYPPPIGLADSITLMFAQKYASFGAEEKAKELWVYLLEKQREELFYYTSMNSKIIGYFDEELFQNLQILLQIGNFASQTKDKILQDSLLSVYLENKCHIQTFSMRVDSEASPIQKEILSRFNMYFRE